MKSRRAKACEIEQHLAGPIRLGRRREARRADGAGMLSAIFEAGAGERRRRM